MVAVATDFCVTRDTNVVSFYASSVSVRKQNVVSPFFVLKSVWGGKGGSTCTCTYIQMSSPTVDIL